jgi:HEAT repeat protein
MDDESTVEHLLLVLNDPNLDPWMRVTAASHLKMLRATEAVPDFERLATSDPSENVRWAALSALFDLAECNSTEVLKRALEDSVQSNRQLAAHILERINLGKICMGD